MSTPADAFRRDSNDIGRLLATRPLVHALNFHNTPASRRDELDRQLRHCAQYFSAVDEDDLDSYLASGRWHKDKPGMILAFYEGYRNGFDVVRPLLETHGLTGWFFVITGFIDAPPGEQLEFAAAHGIDMDTREYADGRYALSWDEIRQLDGPHVVASHARSHRPIAPMDAEARAAEVKGSQRRLTEELGHTARTFVSWGGPAYGDEPVVDRLVDEAGYQFQFSNFRIQRLRGHTSRP